MKTGFEYLRDSSMHYRIHEQRLVLGMTTAECALRTSISRQRWDKFQFGQGKELKGSELRQLAFLGFDMGYVLLQQPSFSPDEKALLDNYRASDEAGQKAMRRVGSALAQPLIDADENEDDGELSEMWA